MNFKSFTQRSLLPLGLFVAFLLLPLRGFADLNYLTSDSSMYYDIDGDGKREWCSEGHIFRLNDDYSDVEKVASLSLITNPKGYFINEGVFYFYEVRDYVTKVVRISSDFQEELVYEWNTYENLNFADLDNDGKIKIFTNPYSDVRKGDLGFIQGDEFFFSAVEFMTPEDAAGEIKELNNSSYRNPLDNSVWLPVGDDRFNQTFNHFQSIDLNSDGLMDYIDPTSGAYYENIGSDRLVVGTYGGKITTRDFNGDGLYDFLVFNPQEKTVTVYISSPAGGEANEQVLLKGLYCSENIFCYDFDKDGDIDIMIPIDYFYIDGKNVKSNGGSYLVMMENDGSGKFKMHETFLEGQLRFVDCKDLDGDGKYDVLAVKQYKTADSYDTPNSDIVYFPVDGLDIELTPKVIIKDTQLYDSDYSYYNYDKYNVALINPDNSGKNLLVYKTKETYKRVNKVYLFPDVNEIPSAPNQPVCRYDASTGLLDVRWNASSNKTISSADLSYEIRVGTGPDKGDVFHAKSEAGGTRLTSGIGNCGLALNRVLNTASWPAGKYYISVQAIDPAGPGSRFSDYAIFDKKTPAADFFFVAEDVSKNTEGIVTVRLNHPVENGTEYIWDWNDAKIVEKSLDGAEYKVRFPKEGANTVSLYAKSGSNIKSPAKKLSINISKGAVENASLLTDEGVSEKNVMAALDMDEDGIEELLLFDMELYPTTVNLSKFYEYSQDGLYSTVKKIFNTNLGLNADMREFQVLDFNKDGKADLITEGWDEVKIFINEGDKTMSTEELDLDEVEVGLMNYDDYRYSFYFSTERPFYDFDNDGNVDFYDGKIYYSDGSLKKYDSYQYEVGEFIYDYNGDGLLDLLGFKNEGDKYKVQILINNGDRSFTKLEESPYHPDISDIANRSLIKIADLNNNGKPDFVTTDSWSGFGVSFYAENIEIFGADGTKTLIPHYQDMLYGPVLDIFDYDNNGIKDIMVETWAPNAFHQGSGASGQMIIYRYPDGRYSYSPLKEDGYYGNIRYFQGDGNLSTGGVKLKNVVNTKPSAPTNVRSSREGDLLVIEWNHSQDPETPDKGMQYNISVKHKGKEGKGAYLISPLNSDKNGVHIPSGKPLLTSNKFSIPIANIPAGEYEVRVQGVDGWYQESDFSETYALNVDPGSYIEMPTSTMVGSPIEVKFIGEASGKENSFGDGAEVSATDEGIGVRWTTPGRKTVTAGNDYTSSIYVYPAPEGDFALPANILAGATVNIDAQNTFDSEWEISVNDSEFMPLADNGEFEIILGEEGKLAVIFSEEGKATLRHTVKKSYGEAVYEHSANVTSENSRPEILQIALDEKTNSYNISWSESAPAEANSINIYKQGAKIDEYRLLATVPVTDRNFVDDSSQPDATASRYRLTYGLAYGESAPGLTYQTIYAKINNPSDGGWNISWSQYEGMDVKNYRIMRGTSPDNLEMISEVGGETLAYKDANPGNTTLYYAVEAQTDEIFTRNADGATRSNVVSTEDAIEVILATSIELTILSENSVLGELNPKVALSAYVYPVNASFKDVNWIVEEGEDLVRVNQKGEVSINPERSGGSATIRANALDGSGVYADISLEVEESKTLINLKSFPSVKYGDEPLALGDYVPGDYDITYTSSNPDIAYIEGDNLVIKGAGEVVISAQPNDNSVAILNPDREILIEKAPIIISVREVVLYTGGRIQDFEYYAEGLKNGDTIFDIDELPDVVVDEVVYLYPQEGEYLVTLTGGSDDNYEIATKDSKVTVYPSEYIDMDYWIEHAIPNLVYGDEFDLEAYHEYFEYLTYEPTDPNVLQVRGNKLIARGAGGTHVRIYSEYGKTPIYCDVYIWVNVDKAELNITVEPITFKVGEWFPDGDFKYVAEGFKFDDTLNDIDELPIPTVYVTPEDGPGVYDVWFVGGWDDNYLISTTNSTVTILPDEDLGVEGIIDDEKEVEIYQLSGIKVFEGMYKDANLQPGFYIIRQNSKTYKVHIDR